MSFGLIGSAIGSGVLSGLGRGIAEAGGVQEFIDARTRRRPAQDPRAYLNAILGQSRHLMRGYMQNPYGSPFGNPFAGSRGFFSHAPTQRHPNFGAGVGVGGLIPAGATDVRILQKPQIMGRREEAAVMGGSTGMGGGTGYLASSVYDSMPAATGLPSYGGGQTLSTRGTGAPTTTASPIPAASGLPDYATPGNALLNLISGPALDKERYYASGGIHDAIDNTIGKIPVLGNIIDFGTDVVQGIFDFVGLGNIFGGNREAKKAREKYMKERGITWRHLQIANRRRWQNFGIDEGKVRRDQGIQDWFLNSQQGLDIGRWNEEDLINDQAFIRNLGLNNQSFNLDRWRYNTLGDLADSKAWTDTDIANNFANAQMAQSINTMLQKAGLEANSAIAANAISTNLIQRVGAIQDATSDKKGALAEFAYRENQRIEDDLYAASVQLDKVGAKRDMMRVMDAWSTKTKMETRANEKLFRGDQIQQQRFQDKVAQQQYKAKLLMSGGAAKGNPNQADPIRAHRVAALAKINGTQNMAAERMLKISKIAETMDFVRDDVERDPENWNQSKKQLQFMLDVLDDI